jgi:hypothetical protein
MQQLLTGKKRLTAFVKESEEQGAKQSSEFDNTSEAAQAAQTKQAFTLNSDLYKESGEGLDEKSNQHSEVGNANNKQTAPRPGYKQTELGEIPEDWECIDLSEVFSFRQGMQVPVEKQFLSQGEGLVRFIRIIDLTSSDEPPRYISEPGRKYHINSADLFMVRYGAPGLIGYQYKGVIANNLFKIIPKIEICNSFYFQYFGYRNADILEVSGSSTMPAISFATLSKIKVIALPKSEQTAIANVLSDMDAELDALQQRLSKTQKIKQGMMQELLTGKTRLPFVSDAKAST